MIYRCPRCEQQFQAEGGGVVRCPACGGEVLIPGIVRPGSAWDREQKGAWADAFFSVIKDAITNPVIFFREVAEGDGWLRPWLFALVISTAVFLVAAAYQAGFNLMAAGAGLGKAASEGLGPISALLMPFSIGTIVGLAAVAMPVATTVGLLIQAGVYHLCLMVLGAARRSFLTTFRVTCYSMAPQVCQIVPFLGGIVAWGWQLALSIIGLKVAHETTYGRSALAVFLPTLLCCSALLIIGAAVAGAAFAAIIAAAK